MTQATARITPGTTAGPPPSLLTGEALGAPVHVASSSDSGFASLISRDDLTAGVILVSLLVAMFWGAAHALSPGHGKTIVAAYLVGTRGTPRQAAYLGLIVTVTHTIGVFALGLVTLALSEFVVPDALYPWLNLVAAVLVVAVGIAVLRVRVLDWQRSRSTAGTPGGHGRHERTPGHGHDHPPGHAHGHSHDHGHGHSHVHGDQARREPASAGAGLLGVGISGGLLPCPSALVVLLAAISLHRVGVRTRLILAFSVGLAATITGIGLVAVSAKRVFNRTSFQGPLVRVLPAVSALVILGFGVVMTVRAVPALA